MVGFDSQLAFERPHIRCKRTLSPSLHLSFFPLCILSEFCFPIWPLKGLWSLYLPISPKKLESGKKKSDTTFQTLTTQNYKKDSEDKRTDRSQDRGGTEKFMLLLGQKQKDEKAKFLGVTISD